MKTLKPSSEEHRQQMISILDKFDLTDLTMPVSKLKEYRKLIVDCNYADADADALYISIVTRALHESDLKAFQGDVDQYARKRGGIGRGKGKKDEANIIKKWLYPLLAECDAAIPAKSKQRGSSTLIRMAKRELTRREAIKRQTEQDFVDPTIKLITKSRIQTWLFKGRPKSWPG